MPTSPAATVSDRKPIGTGPVASRIRLYSGVYLFLFVATHYLNHMLGLHSLAMMEWGRGWFIAVWRFPPVEILLAASLVAHAGLSLLKAAQARTFRLTAWEWAQIAMGVAIPFLIADHVFGTRGLSLKDGLDDTYAWAVWALWPNSAVMQTLALFVVWVHGVIGLHFWLRLKPWYEPAAPWLLGAAVLWPVLAFIGFKDAGMEVARLAAQDGWVSDMLFDIGFPGREAAAWVYAMGDRAAIGTTVAVVLAASWRTYCWRRAKRLQGPTVTYPDGTKITVAKGVSVLEASELAGVPHASVCGGRGRCSTCRVRVSAGLIEAPPADEGERKVLDRIKAPPGVRLACQLRPTADVSVAPLLPANATAKAAHAQSEHESGSEREIAILFADIRAFTKLSEDKLPFDIVFLLNQYFRSMGQAIEGNGGRVDKFIGDGIMALFGINADAKTGCRQALAATAAMSKVLGDLNAALENDLDEPLRIGVGVHVGSVIVGEMGFSDATSITAIGDAVNVASRLETMTKDFAVEAIVSQEVLATAGVPADGLRRETVSVRGRDAPLDVAVMTIGRELSPCLEAAKAPA